MTVIGQGAWAKRQIDRYPGNTFMIASRKRIFRMGHAFVLFIRVLCATAASDCIQR